MPLNPVERSLRARIGANQSWANTPDFAARTAPARKAALDRFERLVDPDGNLPPEQRAKQAAKARQAHMQAMSLKAAAARRKKREAAEKAADPAAA
jgi:hypothetical protein